MRTCLLILVALLALPPVAGAQDEDGYELWLRHRPLEVGVGPDVLAIRPPPAGNATLSLAVTELRRGLEGLLDRRIGLSSDGAPGQTVLVGTPETVPQIAALGLGDELQRLGPEGFVIRENLGGFRVVIASVGETGALYGAFHLLRLLGTGAEALQASETPAVRMRVLNHWDNLDRTVERGYSGFSLWDWHRLPDHLPQRYTDYARANASLGINGTVLTNVNANALVLTASYLEKVAALANLFRPWGIRVFLTARFSAPMEIGGLETADPADPEVQAWWRAKSAEIYRHVPDFGGFLVKANSEGQPGPQDFGRNHADGANMLADAVAPFGGVVMWRAFVYTPDPSGDRAGQAFDEFVPLDGVFRENVLIQVKNGPIDFQPREPFHPMFGAMPETPLMMEFQITKEYLGLATHLAYLGAYYEEVLQTDTRVGGAGSTVAQVVDGSLHGQGLTGIAGVANIGTDRNWCGSYFDCANWYAFGRLAWDPHEDARGIAREWLKLTFNRSEEFVEPALDMMMMSRQAAVDYRTPLGLHHLMALSHHYGPGPWIDEGRPDWTSVYYHRADSSGIGFDRSLSGSGSVRQYHPEVASVYGDPETVPEEYLLWFHHVSWDREMASGRTLWDELALRYQHGVDTVRRMRDIWGTLDGFVDPLRWQETAVFLEIQEREAIWWRDACLLYFQTFSRRPLPDGVEAPAHDLEYYLGLRHRYVPGIPDSGE